MKKAQAVVSGVLALITGGMLGAAIYLVFVFPKTLAVWAEEARALSGLQMLMANICSFCISYALVILPIFLLGFLASLLWLILAVLKKSTANRVRAGV